MYSKFRNRVMFPISSEAGKSHRLHRTHPRHRRKVRPQISQFPRDSDLFQKPRPLQSRSRQRVDQEIRLRHPRRRPDGLHLRLRRRIPQRNRQQRHRLHRTPSQAAGPLQQECSRKFRSRHRRSQSHRAHPGPAGRRRIPNQSPHPRPGIRPRPLSSAAKAKMPTAKLSATRKNISTTSSSAPAPCFPSAAPKAKSKP